MFIRKLTIAALATTLIAGSAASASAATWNQRHPRRAEVNHRLARQDHRINRDLRQGKISAQEATQLHRDDRSIRTSERTDAKLDNSHITRADRRSLNQNENAVSRDIHQAAH